MCVDRWRWSWRGAGLDWRATAVRELDTLELPWVVGRGEGGEDDMKSQHHQVLCSRGRGRTLAKARGSIFAGLALESTAGARVLCRVFSRRFLTVSGRLGFPRGLAEKLEPAGAVFWQNSLIQSHPVSS